ncbi:hypothetical protein [Aquamicrobium defluvii]|uniref:Uncharacterized protein n=1 Tax=Aquamicrobium defluvii TaxID=69279 RepID=A0A4R6YGU1_9HYPH|nr:hypothetical protein [Aquamicrobium defluvii]TDR35718.1 hypothetical protein DES43_108143 [Aquamicrobium defluvii]
MAEPWVPGYLRRRAEELIRTKVDLQSLEDMGPPTVRRHLAAEHERLSSSASPAALLAVSR